MGGAATKENRKISMLWLRMTAKAVTEGRPTTDRPDSSHCTLDVLRAPETKQVQRKCGKAWKPAMPQLYGYAVVRPQSASSEVSILIESRAKIADATCQLPGNPQRLAGFCHRGNTDAGTGN